MFKYRVEILPTHEFFKNYFLINSIEEYFATKKPEIYVEQVLDDNKFSLINANKFLRERYGQLKDPYEIVFEEYNHNIIQLKQTFGYDAIIKVPELGENFLEKYQTKFHYIVYRFTLPHPNFTFNQVRYEVESGDIFNYEFISAHFSSLKLCEDFLAINNSKIIPPNSFYSIDSVFDKLKMPLYARILPPPADFLDEKGERLLED